MWWQTFRGLDFVESDTRLLSADGQSSNWQSVLVEVCDRYPEAYRSAVHPPVQLISPLRTGWADYAPQLRCRREGERRRCLISVRICAISRPDDYDGMWLAGLASITERRRHAWLNSQQPLQLCHLHYMFPSTSRLLHPIRSGLIMFISQYPRSDGRGVSKVGVKWEWERRNVLIENEWDFSHFSLETTANVVEN